MPMLRIILLVFLTLLLSNCRYWALYKFADQFCEFDQNVSVLQQEGTTHIDFLQPVLARTLLLRYLHATPTLTTYALKSSNATASARSDTFLIQRTNQALMASLKYEIQVNYHLVSDTPLLSAGGLGAKISHLFSPAVVESILKSICSDDYDLSLKRLDMRFTLKGIQREDLPVQKLFIDTFGEPDKVNGNGYQYQFDFIQERGDKQLFQHKPIHFTFGFDETDRLKSLHVLYYKYDYWLDFEHQKGRLVVNRA